MGGLPRLAAARTGGSSGSVNAERHQLVMRLFQQALDRQEADRGAFLHTACGTDETLREEVESLLSHHDPRTIAPARRTAADGMGAAKPTASSSIARLVPQALRPADPNRLRTSLIALALALLLAAIGYLIKTDVERVLRKNLANQLQATLESNIAAVTNWLKLQELEVQEWAQHPDLRKEFQATRANGTVIGNDARHTASITSASCHPRFVAAAAGLRRRPRDQRHRLHKSHGAHLARYAPRTLPAHAAGDQTYRSRVPWPNHLAAADDGPNARRKRSAGNRRPTCNSCRQPRAK